MKTATTWARAAGLRALRTFGQTAAAAIPVTALTLGQVQWDVVASTGALAAVLSLLMALGGLPELEQDATPPPTGYESAHRAG